MGRRKRNAPAARLGRGGRGRSSGFALAGQMLRGMCGLSNGPTVRFRYCDISANWGRQASSAAQKKAPPKQGRAQVVSVTESKFPRKCICVPSGGPHSQIWVPLKADGDSDCHPPPLPGGGLPVCTGPSQRKTEKIFREKNAKLFCASLFDKR